MDSTDSQTPRPDDSLDAASIARGWRWLDWAAGSFLFLATAAVVVWQNARLGVLWDLSYILENSFRISLGDIPYRDFVLPYPPLTFLTQAVLIKFTGRVFFHHVIYCAIAGGLATVITWRIVFYVLRSAAAVPARLVAFLLSAPLVVLGIYCIFPHPFYDPDCTLAILVGIFLLQGIDRKQPCPLSAFLIGIVVVIPLFVKQNAGLAFLASVALAIALLAVLGLMRRQPIRKYLFLFAGMAAGLAVAALLIHHFVGLSAYLYWTMRYAASRRLPSFRDILSVYSGHLLWWWIAAFAAGALLSRCNPKKSRALTLLSISLMSLAFIWAPAYLLLDMDPSERAERLLVLWPLLLIVSFVLAIGSARRRAGFALVLPFIVIATVHGAFLSQQLWGSTYAIWPLFVILLADAIEAMTALKWRSAWNVTALASAISISILVAGAFYTWSHERLDYADLDEGEIAHSTLPPLAGLSVRGPWIPQFEELVRYADREIPRDDGLLIIPGEDLFYYATGRRPRFPVLMFDHTINPYSPEEIVALARTHGIRWLIVKRDLQLGQDPVEERVKLLQLLAGDFEQVESLDNYDVYRRKATGGQQ